MYVTGVPTTSSSTRRLQCCSVYSDTELYNRLALTGVQQTHKHTTRAHRYYLCSVVVSQLKMFMSRQTRGDETTDATVNHAVTSIPSSQFPNTSNRMTNRRIGRSMQLNAGWEITGRGTLQNARPSDHASPTQQSLVLVSSLSRGRADVSAFS